MNKVEKCNKFVSFITLMMYLRQALNCLRKVQQSNKGHNSCHDHLAHAISHLGLTTLAPSIKFALTHDWNMFVTIDVLCFQHS